MTNCRMTNDEGMTNDRMPNAADQPTTSLVGVVIRDSTFLGHSSVVLRHCPKNRPIFPQPERTTPMSDPIIPTPQDTRLLIQDTTTKTASYNTPGLDLGAGYAPGGPG